MTFADQDDLHRRGYDGFVSISSLRASNCSAVPNEPGTYMVLRAAKASPEFCRPGTGGYFKGQDPNVDIAKLETAWVEDSVVLYIGKAGPGRATLRSRLKQYVRFGKREPIGHWGGRYIWQLHGSESLLVCWRQTSGGDIPRMEEKRLIQEFKGIYGRRPFANLKD